MWFSASAIVNTVVKYSSQEIKYKVVVETNDRLILRTHFYTCSALIPLKFQQLENGLIGVFYKQKFYSYVLDNALVAVEIHTMRSFLQIDRLRIRPYI